MSTSESASDVIVRQIVLRPNASLSNGQALAFFLAVSFVSMTIGITFTLQGYWVVLPFYGIELLVLGVSLYVTMRAGARQEVITMTESRVCVEKGFRHPEQRAEFIRGWTQVRLVKSVRYGRPSRLMIRSHGKEVEVGNFLVESERIALATELKKTLL